MRSLTSVSLVLALLLTMNGSLAARPLQSTLANNAPLGQNRLVVFEGFMRSTWGNCQTAGAAVDQLAQDYAGRPVVFLEHPVDSAPPSRYGRWWAAYGSGGTVYLPLIMLDSGNQISSGWLDFYNVYKAMVDTALTRPPQVDVVATQRRAGNKIEVYVRATNRSSVTLSFSNAAAIHALVYEEVNKSMAHADTGRVVRAALVTDIASLVPGDSLTATLQTPDLTGVDWDKLHSIALVDYRPGGSSGAYDMLQAAMALAVQPDSHTFLADPADTSNPSVEVNLQIGSFLTWTAAVNTTWLTVTPLSGSATTHPAISVITPSLSAGWQQGVATFTDSNGSTGQIAVSAYYGSLKRTYLPLVLQVTQGW